jgi:hypothetical protein
VGFFFTAGSFITALTSRLDASDCNSIP